jgi:hypothetical protein
VKYATVPGMREWQRGEGGKDLDVYRNLLTTGGKVARIRILARCLDAHRCPLYSVCFWLREDLRLHLLWIE